jgi:hypothetical protein
VARHDAGFLVVAGGVAGKLQDLVDWAKQTARLGGAELAKLGNFLAHITATNQTSIAILVGQI